MSIENLSDTIAPKSDQLNADDLLTGPITVTVIDVTRGSKDQPVNIVIGGGRQPYKPCKSMLRVLIQLWGQNGKEWVGRSMTLFCDPSVKFGGVALGGIRISHMSHITSTQNLMLTVSRGKKSQYTVHPLQMVDYTKVISEYANASPEEQNKIWPTLTPDQQMAITNAFNQQW